MHNVLFGLTKHNKLNGWSKKATSRHFKLHQSKNKRKRRGKNAFKMCVNVCGFLRSLFSILDNTWSLFLNFIIIFSKNISNNHTICWLYTRTKYHRIKFHIYGSIDVSYVFFCFSTFPFFISYTHS